MYSGLITASTVADLFDYPQPALLYLVPCVLIPILLKAFFQVHLISIFCSHDTVFSHREILLSYGMVLLLNNPYYQSDNHTHNTVHSNICSHHISIIFSKIDVHSTCMQTSPAQLSLTHVRIMATVVETGKKRFQRLPTDVLPRSYNVVLTPDLKDFSLQGKLAIAVEVYTSPCHR